VLRRDFMKTLAKIIVKNHTRSMKGQVRRTFATDVLPVPIMELDVGGHCFFKQFLWVIASKWRVTA
jgi:hypothetical protein